MQRSTAERARDLLEDFLVLETCVDRRTLAQEVVWLTDELYEQGDFEVVDEMLALVDVASISQNLLKGFLAMTYWPRDRLKHREAYLQKVKDRLKAEDYPAKWFRQLI